MAVKINDQSEISIPLRNLIALVAAATVSTYAYFGIIERLNTLEGEVERAWGEIKENDTWIEEWESSGILPLDREQNLYIERLKEDVNDMRLEIKELKKSNN
jgi:hypothetical protein